MWEIFLRDLGGVLDRFSVEVDMVLAISSGLAQPARGGGGGGGV